MPAGSQPLPVSQRVVLGLLVEQPLHGYGIEQLIARRGMRVWTPIGFSSIYQVLDQLAADGLAEVRLEPAPGRGKERRVHFATGEGRRRWSEDCLRALGDPDAGDREFLLALSGLPQLDAGRAVAALRQRRDRLAAALTALDRDQAAAGPAPSHVAAMFGYTRALLGAQHEWVTAFAATLNPATLNPKEMP